MQKIGISCSKRGIRMVLENKINLQIVNLSEKIAKYLSGISCIGIQLRRYTKTYYLKGGFSEKFRQPNFLTPKNHGHDC